MVDRRGLMAAVAGSAAIGGLAGSILQSGQTPAGPKFRSDIGAGKSLNSVTDESRYLVIDATDKPVGIGEGNGLLDVHVYGDRWVVQFLTEVMRGDQQWVRTIDLGAKNYGDWYGSGVVTSGVNNHVLLTMGDSITQFGGYHPQLQVRLAGVNVVNGGIGGTLMSYQQRQTDYCELSFARLVDAIVDRDWRHVDDAVERIRQYPSPFDYRAIITALKKVDFGSLRYMTVFYGTNDFNAMPAALGEKDGEDKTTFNGAINYSARCLMSAFPDLQIGFIAPLYRSATSGAAGSFDPATTPNTLGLFLADYVDAVIDRAGAMSVPCLDLYRASGINKYNQSRKLVDGVHPKPETGGVDIGNKIASFLTASF